MFSGLIKTLSQLFTFFNIWTYCRDRSFLLIVSFFIMKSIKYFESIQFKVESLKNKVCVKSANRVVSPGPLFMAKGPPHSYISSCNDVNSLFFISD